MGNFKICVVLSSIALGSKVALAWQDCSDSPSDAKGPFKVRGLETLEYEGKPIFLHYPLGALPNGASGWPVVIFMHGMTLGWEWYSRHVEHWASHGFIVAFPFVKNPGADDGIIPVTETDAASIYVAAALLRGIANGTIAKPEGMTGGIDMNNVGIAGHSMGGEDAIRAGAGIRVPKGAVPFSSGQVKVTIAQHPSLCTFPPPYPYTIDKAEINAASKNSPLVLFTAENDRAFLPWTPSTEYKCWQAATGKALFVSVKKTVCEAYPPCGSMTNASGCSLKTAAVGTGHFCALDAPGLDTWTSPELKWVTTALRLYLQHNDASASVCKSILWGNGQDSLRMDANMAKVEMHGTQRREIVV